jgi:hypothetical protein
VDRVEKAAAGQPTMNELMHRQADETMRQQQKQDALVGRALTLRSGEALELVEKFQANPDDEETYWTLLRHYEFKQDVKNLDALYLWVIEHHPGGKVWPGYINPKYDRDGYERGKALWLANLSRPGATAEMYQSAAFFLEGDDWPLAESVLQDGRKAHPEIPRGWTPFFARHFARALLGPGETLVQGGVFHKVGGTEAQSEYAQRVRAKLAESTDGELLARTASNLAIWGRGAPGPTRLARTFADRAVSLEPKSEAVKVVSQFIDDRERALRAQQLAGLSPAEVAALSDSDRMLRTLGLLTNTWTENPDEAVVKARELLDLAAHNTKDPLYGNAVYSTNVILGKFALRHGDRKTAVRHLLAAADAPVSGRLLRGEFDMNLPRALIDAGERSAAAEFFDRMAPKMGRAADFKSWAADIRKGVNPETIPTFSYPGCAHDPC